VFDLGAGNGALCRALLANGFEVVGMEPDEEGARFARANALGIRIYELTVEDDPVAILADWPGQFDVVVSTEVIEHLYAPDCLPNFARALIRPGGVLLITTPYHGYIKNLVISLFGKWDQHADPLVTGGHIKFFSRRTISALLERCGYEVVAFSGVGRIPFLWKSMVVTARQRQEASHR
jgi:2-polyprenyl-6-hydroxyphenyl methylase/3-demethylubiquinone-9 3-methyltransferase